MPMQWKPQVRETVTVKRIKPSSWKKGEHATIASNNKAGGTAILSGIDRFVPFKITVTKTWWDYETGQRVVARVADKRVVKHIKLQTDIPGALDPAKDYDPSKIFFHADDFEVAL